ncbi:MAG TPA: radical SAM protein [Candidatus Obscuribacterales bacterium]
MSRKKKKKTNSGLVRTSSAPQLAAFESTASEPQLRTVENTASEPQLRTVEIRPGRKPKVLFVMPKMPSSHGGMQYMGRSCGFQYFTPPLGVMTLAGAISPQYSVRIRDENVESVLYPTEADIVGISGHLCEASHIARVIAIANYFRHEGKVVCIGGPVANLLPDAVRGHCDVLFDGEGELTWPQFLADFEKGAYKDRYEQVEKIDMRKSPMPRVDLIKAECYGVGSVQTTRGCPFMCEFCDIIVMYGRKVRTKEISQVVREIKLWADAGMESIIIADDNFVGNRPYAKELLRAIIRFNERRLFPIEFFTQASIDMAKDPELLELLAKANFRTIFIGIESPRKSSLAETLKVQNVHTADLEEAIHKIQSYGIFVTGGMIVGFDHDDIDIFDEHYEFLQRAGIVFPMLNVLGAMPKTPLFERMRENGRLMTNRGELLTNIQPVCMSYEELERNYIDLIRRVHAYDAMKERHLRCLEFMRKCKFPTGSQKPSLRNIMGFFKTIHYYLMNEDREARKFFVDVMRETLRIAPQTWMHTMRLMSINIHMHHHFSEKANLLVAPPTERMQEAGKESYGLGVIAAAPANT